MEFGIESTIMIAFLLVSALIFLYLLSKDFKKTQKELGATQSKLKTCGIRSYKLSTAIDDISMALGTPDAENKITAIINNL